MKRWPIDPDPRPTLLDLMRDPGTEPRFERPDRPAHSYARFIRHEQRARLARLHPDKNAARPGATGRAA